VEEIRLECLKLTYSPGRSAEEAVARAKELEGYILSAKQSPSQDAIVVNGPNGPTIVKVQGRKKSSAT
jgi:hypothetical protein